LPPTPLPSCGLTMPKLWFHRLQKGFFARLLPYFTFPHRSSPHLDRFRAAFPTTGYSSPDVCGFFFFSYIGGCAPFCSLLSFLPTAAGSLLTPHGTFCYVLRVPVIYFYRCPPRSPRNRRYNVRHGFQHSFSVLSSLNCFFFFLSFCFGGGVG